MATNPASTGKGALGKVSQQQATAQVQQATEPKIRFTSVGQLAQAEKARVTEDHKNGLNNVTKHIQDSSYEAHIKRVIALVEYVVPGYLKAHPEMYDQLYELDYFHAMFSKAGDGSTACPKGEQHFSGGDDCKCAEHYAKAYISEEVAARIPKKPISGLLEAAKKAEESARMDALMKERAQQMKIKSNIERTSEMMKGVWAAKDHNKAANGLTREVVCLWNGYDKAKADEAKKKLAELAKECPVYAHIIKQAHDEIPSAPEHVWTEEELRQHIDQTLNVLKMFDSEYEQAFKEGA